MAWGARSFFFIEYLPAESGTESLILTGAQKKALTAFVRRMRERFQAIFFDFPGDEYALGTCLSAGRGFIHISAEGNIEPCPFPHFQIQTCGQKLFGIASHRSCSEKFGRCLKR